MNAKAFAMRMTHHRFVGYVYAKLTTAFCIIYYSTDKMAEFYFNFGRKWQTKNLHMSKKSSTFVAKLKVKYNTY